ncbi:hypothetical protein [Pyrobaculum aerophilum]|uniref:hypothetical protein n=1 Tax=Pyrobaculum aerophilum TaxID=13773 RepID=UPI0023F2AD22|nr:hypothetical protein [Pyrobaculum aerophilum]MCX8136108.1 hypothetical protein [Pyrobaculum aerophilum]
MVKGLKLALVAIIALLSYVVYSISLATALAYQFMLIYPDHDTFSTLWIRSVKQYGEVTSVLDRLGIPYEPWDNNTVAGTLIVFADVRKLWDSLGGYADTATIYTTTFDCVYFCNGFYVLSIPTLTLITIALAALTVLIAKLTAYKRLAPAKWVLVATLIAGIPFYLETLYILVALITAPVTGEAVTGEVHMLRLAITALGWIPPFLLPALVYLITRSPTSSKQAF